jgi:cytochrome c oxidase subunit 3
MDMNEVQMKKKRNAKRMMLWFGIVSLTMTFAGLTSAYVVSKSRPDWEANLELPDAFTWSTLVIVLSSLCLIGAFRALKGQKRMLTSSLVIATFALGVVFILLQIQGFNAIIDQGYYFTGESSSVKSSYIYILVVLHLAHLAAGMISLSVLLIKQLAGKYNPKHPLGFELAATFWHFVDVLWILLFLFLTFFR